MGATSSSRKATIQTFSNSSFGRLLILVMLLALAAFSSTVVNHFKQNKYRPARQAADSFLTAYTNCDLPTVKRYYTAFQTDTTAASNYQKQCIKGGFTFAYDSTGSYSVSTVKGIKTLSANLVYSAAKKGGHSSKYVVHLVSSGTNKPWTVTSITAVTPSGATPTAQ